MPPPTTPVVKRARKTFNLTEAVQQFNVDNANMHIIEVSDNELATALNDDNDDEDEVEVDADDDDDEDRALIIPDNVHIDLTRSIPPPPVSPRIVEGITSTIRNIHVVNERRAATTRVAPPRMYDLNSDENLKIIEGRKQKKEQTEQRKQARKEAAEKKKMDKLVAAELKK